MSNVVRNVMLAIATTVAVLALVVVLGSMNSGAKAVAADAPAAPAGEYVGSKKCSSCHFKEFMVWKKSKHFSAFTDLPAKYKADASCLKCHITAYGVPGGYKGPSTPDLLGVTCESCHGPGSAHEANAKPFLNKKVLTEDEKKAARTGIQKAITNVCFGCHTAMAGHVEHPKYDK